MEEAGTSDGLALLSLEPEMKTERERALLVKLDEAHRREEENGRAMDALRQELKDSRLELKESEKARIKLFSRPCPFNTLEDWQKCFDLGYASGDQYTIRFSLAVR